MKSLARLYFFVVVGALTPALGVTPPQKPPADTLAVAPVGTAQAVVASIGGQLLPRLTTFAGATLPAMRSLDADGLHFAEVGCKVSSDDGKSKDEMPPYRQFVPACVKHLRQLIAEVDGSYTDVQLLTVLEHECWYQKKFPNACDAGFDKNKHCQQFAVKLMAARHKELETRKTVGYYDLCEEYFILRGGVMPGTEVKPVKPDKPKSDDAPMFNAETMPKVSTTLHCIISLTLQYFAVYTVLAIVRSLNSFGFNLIGVQQILETGCTTVTYAPMLCVLFLGARMRAIQLSQGETEKYKLPQPWVQTCMLVASTAVCLQVILVLLVGCFTGMSRVNTDDEGNLDVSAMKDAHPMAVKLLTIARYIVMAMLYGGFTLVVVGVFMMEGPEEIWGSRQLPVSPAVMCTILLSGIFFLVYLLVAVTKTIFELSGSMRNTRGLILLEKSATSAKMTVNFAPMLCILFIGARMRALQIDPKHGNPQSWAQKCFFMCTFSILVQALLVILLPFVAKGKCQRGVSEGDVAFAMDHPNIGAVMTAIRYLFLLALYGGIIVVIYSVYVIQHPDGPAKTPPVSPAMQCVITLTVQYFLIYVLLLLCVTIKSFWTGRNLETVEADAEVGNEVPVKDGRLSTRASKFRVTVIELVTAHGDQGADWSVKINYAGTEQKTSVKKNAGPGTTRWNEQFMFNLRPEHDLIFKIEDSHYNNTLGNCDLGFRPERYPKSPQQHHDMHIHLDGSLRGTLVIKFELVRDKEPSINKIILILDSARSTVMFAPMLCILFIGARMRALQLTKAKNGTIPTDAGPQKWVQDGMFLATWSVFVQLIMAMIVPILSAGRPEVGPDRTVKVLTAVPRFVAIFVETVRYLSLVCMYGGAVVVIWGIFTMTPDKLPPYNEEHLVPGVNVPKPIGFL